ncbi:MAG: molecular chaperone DnaK, partial [Synechococcus sp. MED850]|nr:molecular chaperone DnaK [Synechococcus sp. MED850]
ILGEPSVEGRHDVIYIDGIPTLQSQDAGEAKHLPWQEPPCILPIDPPGEAGMDCLKLELRLDGEAQLLAEITDLRSGRTWSGGTLGTVR